MKQVCVHCKRAVVDGNIWCQEKNCPAEAAPLILGFGEWFGELEIVRCLVVLPTATLYQAHQNDKPVLLKVAHDGCSARLEREALFLVRYSPASAPFFPRLLPVHKEQPNHVGRVDFRGHVKYYTIYEYLDGEMLSAMLLRNPQPYYKHAIWIMLSLSRAVANLHANNVYHLALNPDGILIQNDEAGIPRPVLVDLGMAASGEQAANPAQIVPAHAAPGYLAPEVSFDHTGDARTDIYGLGLLLYLLLAGRPPRPPQWRPPRLDQVTGQTAFKLEREDLAAPLNELVRQAISHREATRPESVSAFATRLQEIFGEDVPPPKPKRRFSWRSLILVAGIIILLLTLVALAIILNEAGG